MEFNWLGYRTAMKFAVDTKIREKSELERVRGVGNGMRFFFFLPPPFSPLPPQFSSTIVEVSYIFTHALADTFRGYTDIWLMSPWILAGKGFCCQMELAGEWENAEGRFGTLIRDVSLSLFLFSFFLEFRIMRVDGA